MLAIARIHKWVAYSLSSWLSLFRIHLFHFIFRLLRGCLRFPFYTFLEVIYTFPLYIPRGKYSLHFLSTFLAVNILFICSLPLARGNIILYIIPTIIHETSSYISSLHSSGKYCLHFLSTFLAVNILFYRRVESIHSDHILITLIYLLTNSYHLFIFIILRGYLYISFYTHSSGISSYARYRSHSEISSIFTIQLDITF